MRILCTCLVVVALGLTACEIDQTMRVSDRLVLNAPEGLNVKHFIIGERPEGDYNTQHEFISNRSELEDRLQGGRSIYSG